eukprot:TRINITY_DN2031_c0_g1_i6.p1 TRINITY_DN2031_c0_g1~~TRINITY_DN2031_c0_g1_i6.p1  ORF type:complete len:3279 (+),score=1032.07 TRINITY_DN2031_c0_g1_i6:1369-11205(+)
MFLEEVEVLRKICALAEKLYQKGNFMFRSLKIKFKVGMEIQDRLTELKRYFDLLEDQLKKWTHQIEEVREGNPFMNCIQGQNLWLIGDFLENKLDKKGENSFKSLLEFIQIGASNIISDIQRSQLEKYKPISIQSCSNFIIDLIKMNKIEKKSTSNGNKNLLNHEKASIFTVVEEDQKIVKSILSLFESTGINPSASNFLFSTRFTNKEQISMFINRCFNRQERNLFVVCNSQELSYENQQFLSNLIEFKKERNDQANLALFYSKSNEKNSYLCHKYQPISLDSFLNVNIKDYYEKYGVSVTFVSSDLSGMGKTYYIEKREKEISSVCISGAISGNAIIKMISSQFSTDTMNSLHIILSEHTNFSFSLFLFQLVVCKVIQSNSLFQRVPSNLKKIYVEISNTIGNKLLTDLKHTTKYFENKVLNFESQFQDFEIIPSILSPVQIVCNYLKYYENNTLSTTNLHFTNNLDELSLYECYITPQFITLMQSIPKNECLALLKKYFWDVKKNKGEEVSMNLLTLFLTILSSQLENFSNCESLCENSLICEEIPKNVVQQVRTAYFNSLYTFALRTSQRVITEDQFIHKNQNVNVNEMMIEMGDKMIKFDDNQVIIFFNKSNPPPPFFGKWSSVPNEIKVYLETQGSYNSNLQNDNNTPTPQYVRERLRSLFFKDFPNDNYVITLDNAYKMALILFKIRACKPVILLGETGCGKTFLINQLAKYEESIFNYLLIHAGTKMREIEKILNEAEIEAKKGEKVWVFFDEINTSTLLPQLSEIICHHRINGKKIHDNIVFLGACNPYKKREKKFSQGLIHKKLIDDPLSMLKYRVLPLIPYSLEHIFDFGEIQLSTQKLYIEQMVQSENLFSNERENINLAIETLHLSQQIAHKDDTISLRDVKRCISLMKWFMNEDPSYSFKHQNISKSKRAIILALAICYSCRYDNVEMRDTVYLAEISKVIHKSVYEIKEIIKKGQMDWIEQFEFPSGIARNDRLVENIWVILVSIFNRIPLFVVGQPGSSKTLAMNLILENLRGQDSNIDHFKKLPSLNVFAYQGSHLSDSAGVEKVFKRANDFLKHSVQNKTNNIVVIQFDEIGLAEISKHNPLKVLHSLLDPSAEIRKEERVAVIGLSNWAIDSAKMNRAVHLSCPPLSEKDLIDTSYEIYLNIQREIDQHNNKYIGEHIKHVLRKISSTFFKHYQSELGKTSSIHGLREFYALVKFFSFNHVKNPRSNINQILLKGVLKEFGGEKLIEKDNIHISPTVSKFLDEFEIPINVDLLEKNFTVQNFIEENLFIKPEISATTSTPVYESRNLMLVTRGNVASELLKELIKKYNKRTEKKVIKQYFRGSAFNRDLNNPNYPYQILSKIMLSMESGELLILESLDSVYDSLFDVLNQKYSVLNGQKFSRIALGSYSNPLCYVHNDFRVIVIVQEDKFKELDSPFLSRFEKHFLSYDDIISPQQTNLIQRINGWIEDVSTCYFGEISERYNQCFIGFNEDTVNTLVIDLSRSDKDENTQFTQAKERLIQTMSQDCLLRLSNSKVTVEEQVETAKIYFENQKRSSFGDFWNFFEENLGSFIVITTFSDFNEVNETLLKNKLNLFDNRLISIDRYQKEKEFEKSLKEFYSENTMSSEFGIYLEPHLHSKHLHQIAEMIENFHNRTDKRALIFLRLTRSNLKENFVTWSFSQLSQWKQIHFDKFGETSSEFSQIINNIICNKNEELWKYDQVLKRSTKSFEFESICEQVLFWCILSIKNKNEENHERSEALRNMIAHNPNFLEFLKEKIINWLNEQEASWKKQCFDKLLLEQWSNIEQVFKEGLKEIVKFPLLDFIFKLEKEHALFNYFTIKENLRQEWKKITEIPLFQINDSTNLSFTQNFVVEKEEKFDQIEKLTQFPFSFFFFKKLDSSEMSTLLEESKRFSSYQTPPQLIKQISDNSQINLILHQKWVLQFSFNYFNDFCCFISKDQKIPVKKNREILMRLFSVLFPQIFIGENHVNIFLLHYLHKEQKNTLKHIFLLFNEGFNNGFDPMILLKDSNQLNFINNTINFYCQRIKELIITKQIDKFFYLCENLLVSLDYIASVSNNINLFQTKILYSFISEVGKPKNCSHLITKLFEIFKTTEDNFFQFGWLEQIFSFISEFSEKSDQDTSRKLSSWMSNVFSRTILYLDVNENEDQSQSIKSIMEMFVKIHSKSNNIKLSFRVQIFSNLLVKKIMKNESKNVLFQFIKEKKIPENKKLFFELESTLSQYSDGKVLEDSLINNIITDSLENHYLNSMVSVCFNPTHFDTLNSTLQKALSNLFSESNSHLPKLCSIALVRSVFKHLSIQMIEKNVANKKLLEILWVLFNQNNQLSESLKLYLVKNIFLNSDEKAMKSCLDYWSINRFEWMSNFLPKDEQNDEINPFMIFDDYQNVVSSFQSFNEGKKEKLQELFEGDFNKKYALHGYIIHEFYLKERKFEINQFKVSDDIKQFITKLSRNDFDGFLRERDNEKMKSVIVHFYTVWNLMKDSFLFSPIISNSNILNHIYVPSSAQNMSIIFEKAIGQSDKTAIWKCNNCNEIYFMGECGRPMQVSKCTQCGSSIGGTNHNAVGGVSQITNKFEETIGVKEEPEPLNNKDACISQRDLTPSSYRILHFLIYTSTLLQKDTTLKNVVDHLKNDWEVLKKILAVGDKQISALFHQVIFSLTKSNIPPISNLTSPINRNDWEMTFQNIISKPIIENLEEKVNKFIKTLQEKSENIRHIIVDKIQETDEPNENTPFLNLLRTTIPLNYNNFQIKLKENSEKNVLLSLLLKYSKKLEPLSHFIVLLNWSKLLSSHFKLKVTIHQAREITVAEVFNLKDSQKGSLKDAPFNEENFLELSNAWNSINEDVSSFQCDQNFKMGKLVAETSLSTLLMTEFNDGQYFLAAFTYLSSELQNNFLQKIAIEANENESIALQMIQFQKNISVLETVSLKNIKEEDIISLGKWAENNFANFCENEIEYGKGKQLKVDFEMMEKLLMRSLLWKKKLILCDDFEEFCYAGEIHIKHDILHKLNDLIGTETLSQSVSEEISNFECERASKMISQVETIFLLLTKTKDKHKNSLSLEGYTTTYLNEKERINNKELLNTFPVIKLSQLKKLYESLESVVCKTTINKILKEMKEDLPQEFKQKEFIDDLEKRNIDCNKFTNGLKRFIHRYLIFEASTIKPDHPLIDNLLRDSLWEESTFPSDQEYEDIIEEMIPEVLFVKHAFSLFEMLDRHNKEEKKISLSSVYLQTENQQIFDENEEDIDENDIFGEEDDEKDENYNF